MRYVFNSKIEQVLENGFCYRFVVLEGTRVDDISMDKIMIDALLSQYPLGFEIFEVLDYQSLGEKLEGKLPSIENELSVPLIFF